MLQSVASLWDAWIEIERLTGAGTVDNVASLWDAWIEIGFWIKIDWNLPSRIPLGCVD